MATATQEQKYINRRQFPVILIDGTGGHTRIEIGEVVGEKYAKLAAKNGLEPYFGERQIGRMTNVQAKQMIQEQRRTSEMQVKRINGDPVAPTGAPKIEGAQSTEAFGIQHTQEKYMDKSGSEWLQYARNGELGKLSKGQLQGLATHLGLNMSQVQEKVLLAQNLTTHLENVFGASVPKK